MYLKRIELEGFKSFADRTVIPVERGLTGIVGPNGCGKSNVVDALIWVMGERSAKALRADAMDDVIFKGAEGRASAPYAMVEIILGDEKGEIVEAGGEVAVGRRLFKTGEAEFLLNGRKVRRKDVRELLMDTGLGVRGYMVLAQGKIAAVLEANPAERRSIFEEAAGISRYKERKKETQRKLAQVALDLTRVDDVLEEVRRSVRSLRIQAGKAQRFLEMRDRYRELRVRVALLDSTQLRADEKRVREEAGQLEKNLQEFRDARDAAEKQLAALTQEEEVLRDRHDTLRQEASANKEGVARLEERIHGQEARTSELKHQLKKDEERLAELISLGEGASAEALEMESSVGEAFQAREAAGSAMALAEATFQQARDAGREAKSTLEVLRSEILEALSERTRCNNLVADAAKARSEVAGSLSSLQRRQSELLPELQTLKSAHQTLEAAQEASRAQSMQAQADLHAVTENRMHLRAEEKGYADAAADARRRAVAARARLEALTSLEEDMQGLPPEIRDLLQESSGTFPSLLLDQIQVAAPWDRLLENILGRLQHALWTTNREARNTLTSGSADLFFPFQNLKACVEIPGAIPLRQILQGSADSCDALCSRLGAVYTVKSGANAAEFAEKYQDAFFLSEDGELHGRGYCRVGMLTSDSVGVLARRNDRTEASALLDTAEVELESDTEKEKTIHEKIILLTQKITVAEQTSREALSAQERADVRLQESGQRMLRRKEEASVMATEKDQLEALLETAEEKETQATKDRDAAEVTRLAKSESLSGLERDTEEKTEVADQASQQLQETRVEFHRQQQAEEHLTQRVGDRKTQAQKASAERAGLTSELKEFVDRIAELEGNVESAKLERTTLLGQRTELDGRVGEASAQSTRASDVLHKERSQRTGEQGHLDQLMEQRQALALDEQKYRLQFDELVRGIQEEFHQDLEDLASSLQIDPTVPAPEGMDPALMHEEYSELRAKIESIGSVNLDAVNELDDREARLKFLDEEQVDLQEAQGNLEATLEELDIQCRERFVETFELVQGHFEQIFRRLFRGGKAEITLTADMDPLDAGIEITARLPGKNTKKLSLLSGGEQTLTALSLLLAVFQSRPSPFCLLDEVDAALDDANVERFIDVVQEFSDKTQFMVVTHNRITMSRCERLFGVTMRKRGVSMLVSVDMADIPSSEASMSPSEQPSISRASEKPEEPGISDVREEALRRATNGVDEARN